jgi:lipopolysaccharide/colanic/teichoic acid biosynthesis glycosyltransferase
MRADYDVLQDKLVSLTPYLGAFLASAIAVFLIGGLDRTPWRYSSVTDHLQIIVLTTLVTLSALVITFAINRLDGVSRSLPVIQGALTVTILIGARSLVRLLYSRKMRAQIDNDPSQEQSLETVLVIGVNPVCELFLLSVREFAYHQLKVAGVIAETQKMRGRAIQQKPVLGGIEDLKDVLQTLEVHGTAISKLIVAIPRDRMGAHDLERLLEIERSSDIVVEFISERLGFTEASRQPMAVQRNNNRDSQNDLPLFASTSTVNPIRANKGFVRFKRIADLVGAVLLLLIGSPVLVLVSFVVALDVGFPVIFWQQRPGLYGRPFKLYKFRTMRAAHDHRSQRIPDDQRSSLVGRALRRMRIDELPQVYNVLIGDMSFVGPRPLLPRDQSRDYAARLSVRPGITGWAQVNGGRIISPTDKCILDVWYAENGSVVLDIKIILLTIKMILFGDRLNREAIDQARGGLGIATHLKTDIVPAE